MKPGAPLALAGTCELQRVRQAFFLDARGLPDRSFLRSDTTRTIPSGQAMLLRP
jgi:hypothetical protein